MTVVNNDYLEDMQLATGKRPVDKEQTTGAIALLKEISGRDIWPLVSAQSMVR